MLARRNRRLAAALALALGAACAGPISVGSPAITPAPATPPAEGVTAPPATPPAPVTLEGSLLMIVWRGAENQHVLLPVHPLTGEPLPGYTPISLGHGHTTAFSPDARTLAVATFATEEPARGEPAGAVRGGEVLLIDIQSWLPRRTGIAVADYPALFQFAPDGQSLLIAETRYGENRLRRVDPASGRELAAADLPFYPHSLAFTPEGAGLMFYGTQGDPSSGLNPMAWAARLDAVSLAVEWLQELAGVRDGQYTPDGVTLAEAPDEARWHGPALAWAPGGARLLIVHADDERLTTVDFARETMQSTAIEAGRAWLGRLLGLGSVVEAKLVNGTLKQAAIAPDGERLYVVGYKTEPGPLGITETPLGLRVVEATTGRLLAHVETEARTVWLSADGAWLFLEAWGEATRTEVLSAADLSRVAHSLPDMRLIAARRLGGEPLLLGVRETQPPTAFQLLDPTTLRPLGTWTAHGHAYPLWPP